MTENPNSTCTAKVGGGAGKKRDKKTLNPLFMSEILPKILDYLDMDSLKESRQACSFWGFEGGKILLQKTNVKIDRFENPISGNETIIWKSEELENFLNTKGISAPFNSSIMNLRNPDSLKNIPRPLLQRVGFLSLNPSSYPEGHRRLLQFLDLFPNLQVLHLGNRWDEILEDFSPEDKKSLLEKFESLKEIRLKFSEERSETQQTFLMNLLFGMKNQLAVKEVHFAGYSVSFSSFFEKYEESGCNWPIESLHIKIWELLADPQHFNQVQIFLEKISGSLKHLEWTFTGVENFYWHLPAEYFLPWANNLMHPSTFNGLETLKIFCEGWDYSGSDFFWFFLTCVLQLPNLKKLTMNTVPRNLEERIGEWNDHPNANGRTLNSQSLEELEIYSAQKIGVESLIIFSRRLSPNLKSLSIEHPPMNLPTSFLLSEWTGLERLDIQFEKMSMKGALCWTKWLTCGNKSKDPNPDGTPFTLKDLKDLKHLGLWEEEYDKSHRIATDFLADSSLKFMTQLQSLHLANSKISEGVEEMLKETLGPTVNVEFQSGTIFGFRCRRNVDRCRSIERVNVETGSFSFWSLLCDGGVRSSAVTHFSANLVLLCLLLVFVNICSYFWDLLLSIFAS